MTVTYNVRKDGLVPTYRCHGRGRLYGDQPCEHVPEGPVDVAIGQLLLEAVTPLSLEVALTVQRELQARLDQADKLRLQQVERARYEADLARRRYMQADLENRLVADELEGLWNQTLPELKTAQENCERQRQADRETLDPGHTQRVM